MRSSFMADLKSTFGISKTQKVFFSLILKDKTALYVSLKKKRSDYMFDYSNRKRRIYSWISRKPSMAISASPRSLAFGPSLFRSFIESSTRTKNGPKTKILISFRAKMRIKDSNGKTATLDYRLYRSMKRLRIQTCPGLLHL